MDSLIAPETYRRKLAVVSFIRRETHSDREDADNVTAWSQRPLPLQMRREIVRRPQICPN